MEHDFNRPFREQSTMETFRAIDKRDARRFGAKVKAMEITNREYAQRYSRFAEMNNMRNPPSSSIHIMMGRLVVRRLGTSAQYETWMPSDVFEELYEPDKPLSQGTKAKPNKMDEKAAGS